MGKMPLAGLIGACSLGIVLTGCNCCNKRPSYAGGRADSSMGILSGGRKSQNSSITAPLEDAGGRSIGSSSSAVSPTDFVPRSSSPSSVGMTTPSSSGSMTPMNANTPSPSTLSGPMSSNSSSSQTAFGAGSKNPLPPAPIQQVSHQTDTAYPSADADGTAYLPMKGPSRVIPPPPSVNSDPAPLSTKISSTAAPKKPTSGNLSPQTPSSSLPPAPPPPPSDNTSLSDPPPSVNLKSMSSASSSNTAPPTTSTSLMLPDYMKK